MFDYIMDLNEKLKGRFQHLIYFRNILKECETDPVVRRIVCGRECLGIKYINIEKLTGLEDANGNVSIANSGIYDKDGECIMYSSAIKYQKSIQEFELDKRKDQLLNRRKG